MAYPTMEQYNITGMDGIIVYINTAVPSFIIFFLFCVFGIVFLATYYGSRKLSGNADIIASFAASSLTTFILVILMKIQAGIITDIVFYVSLCLAIASVILMLFAPKFNR